MWYCWENELDYWFRKFDDDENVVYLVEGGRGDEEDLKEGN